MTNKLLPAGLDCLGCHFCEVRVDNNDRNIPVCTNPAIAAVGLPADVTGCFHHEIEVEAASDE